MTMRGRVLSLLEGDGKGDGLGYSIKRKRS
jgi:hypothetical protein